MSRGSSLNLSPHQYRLVAQHSRGLQPFSRSKFLANVTDRLEGLRGDISDDDVIQACVLVLRRMHGAAA
jgi:hypothetical protein